MLASRAGSSAVEFAIMFPLLATMMFGTLQVGLLMYSYNLMVTAARDTTRQMAVCSITDNPTATAQALKTLSTVPWVTNWTVTPTINAGTHADVSTTIQVPMAQASLLTFLPFGVGNLSTTVVMTKEPLAYGTGVC